MNEYYLYCNSNASSHDGTTGWLTNVRRKSYNGFVRKIVVVSTEFALAKAFDSFDEAADYNNKHKLPCIIFERHYESPT